MFKMHILQCQKRQKNYHNGRNHKSTLWMRPPCQKKCVDTVQIRPPPSMPDYTPGCNYDDLYSIVCSRLLLGCFTKLLRVT